MAIMLKKYWQSIKHKDLYLLILLLFLATFARLVIIFDLHLFIDGDEAILGRMAHDFINNGTWPLFFYGQNYGLVFFEVLLASFLGLLFGVNIFTLKIAMLVFFLSSIVALYYLAKKILKSRAWAFLSVLLITSIPVWVNWSMRARGGYLTAFLLSNIIIYLTFLKKSKLKIILISLFLIIIYYAQPLWLVILLPFLVYYFLNKYKLSDLMAFIVSSALTYFSSCWLLKLTGFNFQAQNKLGLSLFLDNIKNSYSHYLVAYSGRFFYSVSLSINTYLKGLAIIYLLILGLAMLYSLYLTIRKKSTKINSVFLASVVLYIVFMFFYSESEYAYRFLLPVFVPATFLIVIAWRRLLGIKYEKYLYIFLIIFAIASAYLGVKNYHHLYADVGDGLSEVERVESLENYLLNNDVSCVYGLDWIISQNIYYFMPELASRYQKLDERRPGDALLVDELRELNSCALVGFSYHLPLFLRQYLASDIVIIANRYVVKINPSKSSLEGLGFNIGN